MNKSVRAKDLNTTLQRERQDEPFLNRYASMSVEARSNIKALIGYKGPKNWEG